MTKEMLILQFGSEFVNSLTNEELEEIIKVNK